VSSHSSLRVLSTLTRVRELAGEQHGEGQTYSLTFIITHHIMITRGKELAGISRSRLDSLSRGRYLAGEPWTRLQHHTTGGSIILAGDGVTVALLVCCSLLQCLLLAVAC